MIALKRTPITFIPEEKSARKVFNISGKYMYIEIYQASALKMVI